MSKFSDFEDAVIGGAKDLATSTFKDFVTQAEEDAKDFLTETAKKLEKWTAMLQRGDLTKLEFTSLVESQKGLATLNALAHEGQTLATLQRFRDGLINVVVNAAFKTFLP